jgi:Glycosyl hydrolase family 65, N-terminal domain
LESTHFDPALVDRFVCHAETLFALSNGYLGMRGTFEEGSPVGEPGVFLDSAREKVAHDYRVIVCLVACRIEECHDTSSSHLTQSLELVAMLLELRPIPPLELLPACRIVPEPFPQLGAWGDLLHPMVDGGFRLRDAARPKAVDQHARSIVG